ncbi:MAG: zinc-ribbon domain-containing protein [Terracidiphilus sp.]|nr:zinc-ribbon domain-containing protein [Terracidiphilus sp.]
MFCSRCGQTLQPGQPFCPQCGQPSAPIAPPVPGIEYQLDAYANKVKTLSIFWFVYAALSLLLGIASLQFTHMFIAGSLGPWFHGSEPVPWFFPALMRFAWIAILIRSALAGVAAWGLWEREPWGRIVAIVAAFLSLLKFPFGTAIGIWTLVTLMGYRNSTLYDQLPHA